MGYFASNTNTPDTLLAGANDNYVVLPVTVLAGEGILSRGSCLGNVTATGLKKLCATTNDDDGSRTAECILCEDIDASGDVDVVTCAWFAGEFNRNAVIFGGEDTYEDHEATLQGKGIYLRASVPA